MTELKNYQEAVLERLSTYLQILNDKRQDMLELAKARQKREPPAPVDWGSTTFNFCRQAWTELGEQHLLPLMMSKEYGRLLPPPHQNRMSGLRRPIPNICLKVPTGGGKTLLASASIERIQTEFFRQKKFVLWVVPSDSIYKQTLKVLFDRESLYRQILDCTGKVKILQKKEHFQPQDAKDFLCVMLLMLQSAGRESNETLRIFKDSGKFPYFFPEIDDADGNQKLLDVYPNLDIYKGANEVFIKQSLGNVLKLLQPLIIIDEGHRAYSEKAKKRLMDFNPSFILELSATPNKKEHHSNVLVSVSGEKLKAEEMIKLPINIYTEMDDWKKTLAKGYEVLQNLSKDAEKAQRKHKRYIRPIMLIRVERTGTDQRDKNFIHAEDVKEYLIKNFNVDPDEVKIKSASKDELGNEDLLSKYSKVRYIITKEALKEGWDCPFAYVLTILSKTKAPVAVEQMIGRVLRQPYTQRTAMNSLNQCYVICRDQEVKHLVEGVRKGLENEGMDGLAGEINTDRLNMKKEVIAKRRKPFRGLKIFLPKVLYRSDDGTLKDLSYERDLLFAINWSRFKLSQALHLDDQMAYTSHTQVDIDQKGDVLSEFQKRQPEALENSNLDFGFMCRRLSDLIPNPWDVSLMIDRTLLALKRKYSLEKVYSKRFYILDALRHDIQNQVSQNTERLFRKKLKNNEILFKLVSACDPDLNWQMAKTLNFSVSKDSRVFTRQDATPIQLSLFDNVHEESLRLNELEKNVAWYLDENEAIKWWHRILEKQDWHLQGWQKRKVYPDFLVCLKSDGNGHASFSILETKGQFMIGNPDTQYKKDLFDLFTEYSKKAVDAGSIEIQDQKMSFDLILDDQWRDAVNKALHVSPEFDTSKNKI